MSQFTRQYSTLDRLLMHVDLALTTLVAKPLTSARENPAKDIVNGEMSEKDKKLSASLMRVNHAGEICAQALYQGQALTARDDDVREQMNSSALEEEDHLAWCAKRLQDLDSHTSHIGPFWYIGALAIGLAAGACGDKWSLGFLAETEQQVSNHLKSHLERLPENDEKSRAIVTQMKIDEEEHRDKANDAGAAELPGFVKKLMQLSSKIMTKTVHYI